MKTIITFLLIFSFFSLFAQDYELKTNTSEKYLITKTGKDYFYKNEKLNSKTLGYVLNNLGDKKISDMYSVGRSNKSISAVFRIIGIGGMLASGAVFASGAIEDDFEGIIVPSISCLLGGIGIVIFSGYMNLNGNKKIDNAVELFNKQVSTSYNHHKLDLKMGLTYNGIGIILTF